MRSSGVGCGRRRLRPAAAALAAGLLMAGAARVQPAEPVEMAELAPLAGSSLLIDIAMAGKRAVVVGERGQVLSSDDHGASWQQAQKVPTRALLTGVCFFDDSHGIAVGHDEVALTTQDAGRTWKRTHYAPEAQQPLLDVWCGPQGRAIAVGAYGTCYTSEDGGESWAVRRLEAKPAPGYEDDLGGDPHLNRVVAASATRFYIAGEAGHLFRSDDAGASWVALRSPYDGSFFGLLPLGGDSLLAYGLRGHLFRSEDAGNTWARIETGTTAMLNDAAIVAPQHIVIVGLSGVMLESRDGGRSFTLRAQSGRKGLSAVAAVDADVREVIVAGEGGVRRLSLTAGAAR